MSNPPQQPVNDSLRIEYDKLVQEREQLYQERARLFGLKPTVYVRNLDPSTTEAELKQWFQQSGTIKEVRLQTDKNGMFYFYFYYYCYYSNQIIYSQFIFVSIHIHTIIFIIFKNNSQQHILGCNIAFI